MKRNGYIGKITAKSGYLFKDGVTNYSVIIPEKYTPKEAFAAEEMKRILLLNNLKISVYTESEKAEGKKIFIGNTDAFYNLGIELNQNDYKRDGFIIETVGDDYILNTSGDSGNLYAVQTFLGHLADYTFYAVDEEKINQGDIPLKEFHIKEIPSFYGRNAYCYETFKNKEYALRVRCDHPDFEEIYGTTYWSTLTGHTYVSDILPYGEYGQAHPDWYYQPKNFRNRNMPQICFSKGINDDAPDGFFHTFVDNLIQRFIIPQKDKSFFMLGITDHNEYCCCENCQKEIDKYSLSGLSTRFINKVADAVEQWRMENAPDRDIYLVTFAYLWLMKAPTVFKNGTYSPIHESVVARDNVIVRIAPLGADYRYTIMDSEHNAEACEAIKAWSAVAKHLAIWDYGQDFNSLAFTYPDRNAIEETVNAYYKMNIIDVFHQMQATSSSLQNLNCVTAFAYSAKLWNIKENFNELYDEFLEAYYKDCVADIREYIKALDLLCDNMAKRGYTGDIHTAVQLQPEYYTLEEIRGLESILNKALTHANSLQDINLATLLYDRIYPLTFFCKWILLCCFGGQLDKEEFSRLICDLRYNTQKYDVCQFRSTYPNLIRADLCPDVLDVIEQNPTTCAEILKNY